MVFFETYVFNVGNGDNILIEFSTGSYGLIDFFYNSDYVEPPSLTYLKSLKGKGNITIDFLHITHYHQDHTKGLDLVFQWLLENKAWVTLKKIWLPGRCPTQKMKQIIAELSLSKDILKESIRNKTQDEINNFKYQFSFFDEQIWEYDKSKNLKVLTRSPNFTVNKDFKSFCISPSNETVERIGRQFEEYIGKFVNGIAVKKPWIDQNTLSTILIFTHSIKACKDIRFTFGGDATKEDWEDALKAHYDEGIVDENMPSIHSTFIKVSHHGSEHSSSQEIWNNLIKQINGSPTHTFFSCGDKRYPHKKTIMHIENAAKQNSSIVEMFSTNENSKVHNYQQEQSKEETDSNARGLVRALQYGGSRLKKLKDNLLYYKYHYDFNSQNANIIKITRE